MEENKDELLQAFENPDTVESYSADVTNEVGIDAPETSEYTGLSENFMPEEFKEALNQENVQPEPESFVEETNVEPQVEMQNVPENLNPEPVVNVTQDIKEENIEDEDDMSYKKVLIFLAPIVLIMIVFILILPLITKI